MKLRDSAGFWVAVLTAIVVISMLLLYRYLKSGSASRPAEQPMSAEAMLETEARGSQIVSALYRFRDAKGQYPTALDELVPKFAESISPPTAGDPRWFYIVFDKGQSFSLRYGLTDWGSGDSPYPCGYFDSKTSQWQQDN